MKMGALQSAVIIKQGKLLLFPSFHRIANPKDMKGKAVKRESNNKKQA